MEISEARRQELLEIACPGWIEPDKPTGHSLRLGRPKKIITKPKRNLARRPIKRSTFCYSKMTERYKKRNRSILPKYFPRTPR